MTFDLSFFLAGVDFIGPYPSVLIFTPGQTVGDIQCAEFSIPDDSYPQGERSFNVSIGDDAGTIEYVGGDAGDGGDGGGGGRGGSSGGGVRTNPNLPSVTVDIDIDINDSKTFFHFFCIEYSPFLDPLAFY